MILPAKLSANLTIRLARQPRITLIRCLATSQVHFESETSKLIRLRREREAREEQTTGFDKMIQLNELHLEIMRRNETPEIRQRRNKAMLKMIALLVGFVVGVSALASTGYYLFFMWMGKDLLKLPMSHYTEYIPFKYRPNAIKDK